MNTFTHGTHIYRGKKNQNRIGGHVGFYISVATILGYQIHNGKVKYNFIWLSKETLPKFGKDGTDKA